MNIQVKIINVGEVRKGQSTTTGKQWASINVLLGFEDENGEGYINAQVDENVWHSLGHQVGEIAQLNLKFRTNRTKNGFIFNEIRIVDPVNA